MMPTDKKIHLIGSGIVCLALSFVLPLIYAAGVTLVFGAAKELVYDWYLGKGMPDPWDFAADVAGVLLAWVVKL